MYLFFFNKMVYKKNVNNLWSGQLYFIAPRELVVPSKNHSGSLSRQVLPVTFLMCAIEHLQMSEGHSRHFKIVFGIIIAMY